MQFRTVLNSQSNSTYIVCNTHADETSRNLMDWAENIDKLPDTFKSTSDQMLDKECNSFQCGCCCSDVLIKDMVQCADGHLFCFICLRRRVEESTFGELSAYGPLGCMDMNGCEKPIPWSEIERGIQGDLITKFEQRQANESLAHANLQGLIHCPACDFACVVDPDVKVFKYPNKQCHKATCVKCKEPSHEPLRCEDIEKV